MYGYNSIFCKIDFTITPICIEWGYFWLAIVIYYVFPFVCLYYLIFRMTSSMTYIYIKINNFTLVMKKANIK